MTTSPSFSHRRLQGSVFLKTLGSTEMHRFILYQGPEALIVYFMCTFNQPVVSLNFEQWRHQGWDQGQSIVIFIVGLNLYKVAIVRHFSSLYFSTTVDFVACSATEPMFISLTTFQYLNVWIKVYVLIYMLGSSGRSQYVDFKNKVPLNLSSYITVEKFGGKFIFVRKVIWLFGLSLNTVPWKLVGEKIYGPESVDLLSNGVCRDHRWHDKYDHVCQSLRTVLVYSYYSIIIINSISFYLLSLDNKLYNCYPNHR